MKHTAYRPDFDPAINMSYKQEIELYWAKNSVSKDGLIDRACAEVDALRKLVAAQRDALERLTSVADWQSGVVEQLAKDTLKLTPADLAGKVLVERQELERMKQEHEALSKYAGLFWLDGKMHSCWKNERGLSLVEVKNALPPESYSYNICYQDHTKPIRVVQFNEVIPYGSRLESFPEANT
jgi:hypothetical protein